MSTVHHAPPVKGRMVRRGFVTLGREVALHPRPFALGMAGALVYALATVASSYVLGRVVDEVVTPRFEGGRVATGSVVLAVAAIAGVGLVKAAGIVCRRFGAGLTLARVQATLRHQVVAQYQRLPLAWHRSQSTGELLAHVGADVEGGTEALAPLPFASGVVVLVGVATVWLVTIDPLLAVVGLLLVPVLIALNLGYQARVEGPTALAQQRLGEVSSLAHESFDGALTVKTLGAEQAEVRRFAGPTARLREAKVRTALLQASFDAVLDALPALATIVLLVVGASRVQAGAVTAGQLVGVVNLYALITWPLRLIGYVLSQLPRAVAGHDRITGVLAVAPPSAPAVTWPLPEGRLDLEVEGLSFAYEPGSGEPGVPAGPTLEDISFRVPAGTTVAVVGPTGSGKSTLLLVLAGLLEPSRGHVRLGGVDLAEVEAGERAAAVSLAFQEAFLFADTVAENVLLGLEDGRRDGDGPDGDGNGDGASGDRKVLRVASEVAEADGFVERLPAGYDTVVGERGATLSGGQRQRLALARALVRRPRLLLLDDATASVDTGTEARILSRLATHLGTAVTVMVANRPATIALADRVLYLERGRLVADGRPEELLVSCPAYAELVHAYERDRTVRALPTVGR